MAMAVRQSSARRMPHCCSMWALLRCMLQRVVREGKGEQDLLGSFDSEVVLLLGGR